MKKNHRITILAILIQTWIDEHLRWDPKDFGNITYTFVKYSDIWTPKFEHISQYVDENTASNSKNVHKIYENFPVKLYSNGNVDFVPAIHLTSECIFNNYRQFPYEYEICDFQFQIPYDPNQVALVMSAFYTQEFHKYGSIWRIDDLILGDTLDVFTNPVSCVRLKLKRNAKSFLFTMPSYSVYILTILMFLLPQQSGQRVIIGATSLIISTMLSYMMSNSLPHNDISAWPLLGKLYLFNAILLTISLIFSAFIINISREEHTRSVPDWLKRFTINFLSKIFCAQSIALTVFNSYNFKLHDDENVAAQEQIVNQLTMSPESRLRASPQTSADNTEMTLITREPTAPFSFTVLLRKCYNHLEQLRYKLQLQTYSQCTKNEWLLVAIFMDKILFFIYLIIVFFTLITIFK